MSYVIWVSPVCSGDTVCTECFHSGSEYFDFSGNIMMEECERMYGSAKSWLGGKQPLYYKASQYVFN